MKRLLWLAAGAALAMVAAGLTGLGVMYSGVYDVSTITEHTVPVQWFLEQGMRHSVRHHSKGIRAPDLADPELVRTGFRCFHDNCVQCHGAPGVSAEDHGKGLLPIPNSLVQPARDWPAEQLYWVTRNGIRMAGMPAWEFRFADRDLWATVAFLKQLPNLTAAQYREMVETVEGPLCARPSAPATGRPEYGLVALRQYGCHGCHIVPGISGPTVHVGPTLKGFASRKFIAGVLPNTPENLSRWIQDPQGVSALTTMPDLGVTEQHAADMVVYLQTLE